MYEYENEKHSGLFYSVPKPIQNLKAGTRVLRHLYEYVNEKHSGSYSVQKPIQNLKAGTRALTCQGLKNSIRSGCLKKNLNASRPSEHPPVRGEIILSQKRLSINRSRACSAKTI